MGLDGFFGFSVALPSRCSLHCDWLTGIQTSCVAHPIFIVGTSAVRYNEIWASLVKRHSKSRVPAQCIAACFRKPAPDAGQ